MGAGVVKHAAQAGEVAIAQAAIHALEHEAVRVLVTLAPDHAAELGEVPDHVYLSDYVPHSTVLADSRTPGTGSS